MLEKTDLGGQSTRILPGPLVCHVFRGNEPEPERAAAALIPFVFFLFCYAEETKPFGVRAFELSLQCSSLPFPSLSSAHSMHNTRGSASRRTDSSRSSHREQRPDGAQGLPSSDRQQQQLPLQREGQGDESPRHAQNVTPHSNSAQNASGQDAVGIAAGLVNPIIASQIANTTNLEHEADTDTQGQTDTASTTQLVAHLFRSRSHNANATPTGSEAPTAEAQNAANNAPIQPPTDTSNRAPCSNRTSQQARASEKTAQTGEKEHSPEVIQKLRENFHFLRKAYTLDRTMTAQISSAKRYQATNPI
jgi:hypothetical protein